jgi:hypothetical protein
MAVEIASRFTPITQEEEAKLKALARTLKPIFREA